MLAAAAPRALVAPGHHFVATRRGAAPIRRQRAVVSSPRCAAISGSGSASASSSQGQGPALPTRLAHSAAATAAAALLLLGPAALPPPSAAEISTVTAQQATEMAKPLKQQKVDKNRIWLLFVLGGVALFGSTVVLENNEKWFPAISRANRAMKQAQTAAEAREKSAAAEQAAFEARLAEVQRERAADAAVDVAVLEGLREARQRSGSGSSGDGADAEGEGGSAGQAASGTSSSAPPAAAAAVAAAAEPAAAAELPSAAPPGSSSSSSSAEVAPPEAAEGAAAPGADAGSSSANGSSSAGNVSSGEGGAAAAAAAAAGGEQEPEGEQLQGDTRKPLFEISAAQIEASSAERMKQVQQEVERRKAAAAGAQPEA